MDFDSAGSITSTNPIPLSGSPSPTGSKEDKPIISLKLSLVKDQILDITPSATPCRYRFIDCDAFLDTSELRLYEYEDLPSSPFAAVSYVWRGIQMQDDPEHPYFWREELGTFSVRGAEDGDPISLDVLRHVCVAARIAPRAKYLWLDRLCIMQTNKIDKAWQISRMYIMYKCCQVCFVLPGGVQRLVGIREPTTWIYRAWTLQEALVPERTVVIFWCNKGTMPERPDQNAKKFEGTDVIPGKSGFAELRHLLEEYHLTETEVSFWRVCGLFGTGKEEGSALYGALTATDDNADLKYQAIWRSALLRTSSRPVDMVFSIMQLFGVSLDPLKFNQDDRLGATIALASGILANGGKAHWLGSLYTVTPSYQLSTFPQFPQTTVAEYVKGRDMIWRPNHWIHGIPGGSMDKEGYFHFTGEAIPVVLVESQYMGYAGMRLTKRRKLYLYSNKAVWMVKDVAEPSQLRFPRAFAVSFGRLMEYATSGIIMSDKEGPIPRPAPDLRVLLTDSSFRMEGRGDDSDSDVSVDMGVLGDHEWIRELYLIVVEHTPGRFHRADIVESKVDCKGFVRAKRTMDFAVGGPVSLSVTEEEAKKLGAVYYPFE